LLPHDDTTTANTRVIRSVKNRDDLIFVWF
jgi:hypothetical protein